MATTKSVALTEDTLRARFADLDAQIKEVHKVSDPLRAKRDKFVNDSRAKEEEMNKAVREAEKGLFELKSEQAMIVRALKGSVVGETNVVKTAVDEPAPKE